MMAFLAEVLDTADRGHLTIEVWLFLFVRRQTSSLYSKSSLTIGGAEESGLRPCQVVKPLASKTRQNLAGFSQCAAKHHVQIYPTNRQQCL